jgi:arylsulfatase
VADRELAPGRQVLSADFSLKGPSSNEEMPGFEGTLRLYVDDEQVGEGELVTQPGVFCLVGDGICVGRDSASPVTPAYKPPFRFTGGTIDKVVVDVSGKPYIDHEAQVRAWFMRD